MLILIIPNSVYLKKIQASEEFRLENNIYLREMVNNPTFNYGEFAIVNLNIAIKHGNSKLLLPI